MQRTADKEERTVHVAGLDARLTSPTKVFFPPHGDRLLILAGPERTADLRAMFAAG